MLKEAAEMATRSKSGEISIDLEASHNNKLPRLDLIRNEKLVQKNSSSFFDQDDDVFGSGDGKDTKYKVQLPICFIGIFGSVKSAWLMLRLGNIIGGC